jgi:hypothetical protein
MAHAKAARSLWPRWLDTIRKFFHRQGEQVNPEDIARHIDQMILTRPGRWRQSRVVPAWFGAIL